MTSGVLLVAKPPGPTSHDCVVQVRRALALSRVGHLGTLDPFAAGLLVMVAGPATRLARLAAGWSKTYLGTICLGTTTETDDPTGVVVGTSEAWRDLAPDRVAEAMRALEGPSHQRPPRFSAKKVEGERSYRRARRGEHTTPKAVPVTVCRFTHTSWNPPRLGFEAVVSAGTYIRSLARDLGERLGCGAHVETLCRTAVGELTLDEACAPADATVARLGPLEALAVGWPRMELEPDQWQDVRHGRRIAVANPPGTVALFADQRLVGMAEVADGQLQPRVVLPT